MQRASSSIGDLAAALAKAQAELVNPEKSLVGSIHPDGPAGVERIFRYAPLSAGLDIVRKTLGQHDIAVVQTTAVDNTAGFVNLTTVLAHASGEWIASHWPVCAISETKTPHRMGASLTYARRYALFTLVGIAGEDDLDAPDLIAPTNVPAAPEKPEKGKSTRSNDSQATLRGAAVPHNTTKINSAKPVLGHEASAKLRDKLLAELNTLASSDDAANWAYRSLRDKNDLTESDAEQVEAAFRARLVALGEGAQEEVAATTPATPKPKHQTGARSMELANRSRAIDKSVLAVPEPRRIRDRGHVKAVAKRPCLICGRQPSDAHHLRFAQARALGRKASDEFTVPLCRGHHREVHRCSDESEWWRNIGIDPMVVARALWVEGHSTGAGAPLTDVPN
jgi:ERF superfamily